MPTPPDSPSPEPAPVKKKTRRGGKAFKRWREAHARWVENQELSDAEADDHREKAEAKGDWPKASWTDTELLDRWAKGDLVVPPSAPSGVNLLSSGGATYDATASHWLSRGLVPKGSVESKTPTIDLTQVDSAEERQQKEFNEWLKSLDDPAEAQKQQ